MRIEQKSLRTGRDTKQSFGRGVPKLELGHEDKRVEHEETKVTEKKP
jgi:hypothetical protein